MSATTAMAASQPHPGDDGKDSAGLDPETCYRALLSRDARFDGRFFVAVRTTGVYCRPVCPARTPNFENIRFFPCAAAAEDAGFRACLRCRPEVSPGTPAWLGTSVTVSRALRLISEGVVPEDGIGGLAARLGIGERQLRRLFDRHLGASPMAVLRTERLHLAMRLIGQTGLPMTQVATHAGFASVRRFNAAIKEACGRSPTELRRARRAPVLPRDGALLVLRLAYRPPFDWALLADYLRARAIPGVERVERDSYRRTVRCGAAASVVTIRPSERELTLLVELPAELANGAASAIRNARRLFDIGAVPGEIAAHLRRDPLLRRSVDRHPGIRVPGAWDGFELAVRAILGQQVSVRAATTLAGRLVAKFGEPLGREAGAGLTHLFPLPETIADADVASIGLPRARANTIRALARAVCDGLKLEPGADLDSIVGELKGVAGVGDWTAHYVAMRALGEPDAFPEDDLGLRRALAAGGAPLSRAGVEASSGALAAVAGVCGDAPLDRGSMERPASTGDRARESEMNLALVECDSPVGKIRALAGRGGVCDVDFSDRWERKKARLERRFGPLSVEAGDPLGVAPRLRAYFAGDLEALDDLALDPGGTAFQKAVWSALRRIPAGRTLSYGDLAAEIGNPQASRAVGAANGRNPIAIVVPCHRVIGANGSLTGYAGGTWRKRWLLAHEGVPG